MTATCKAEIFAPTEENRLTVELLDMPLTAQGQRLDAMQRDLDAITQGIADLQRGVVSARSRGDGSPPADGAVRPS